MDLSSSLVVLKGVVNETGLLQDLARIVSEYVSTMRGSTEIIRQLYIQFCPNRIKNKFEVDDEYNDEEDEKESNDMDNEGHASVPLPFSLLWHRKKFDMFKYVEDGLCWYWYWYADYFCEYRNLPDFLSAANDDWKDFADQKSERRKGDKSITFSMIHPNSQATSSKFLERLLVLQQKFNEHEGMIAEPNIKEMRYYSRYHDERKNDRYIFEHASDTVKRIQIPYHGWAGGTYAGFVVKHFTNASTCWQLFQTIVGRWTKNALTDTNEPHDTGLANFGLQISIDMQAHLQQLYQGVEENLFRYYGDQLNAILLKTICEDEGIDYMYQIWFIPNNISNSQFDKLDFTQTLQLLQSSIFAFQFHIHEPCRGG